VIGFALSSVIAFTLSSRAEQNRSRSEPGAPLLADFWQGAGNGGRLRVSDWDIILANVRPQT